MDSPKILFVYPFKYRFLRVGFENGIEKIYDCHSLYKYETFQLLKTEAFIKVVKVDPGGYKRCQSTNNGN